MNGKKQKVLFICSGNACRSQMAEAWAKHFHQDEIDAYSAGTEPVSVNKKAVEVMKETGIDISGQRSKNLIWLSDIKFDFVVTVCREMSSVLPVMNGSPKVIQYTFDDPPRLAAAARSEDEVLYHYRRVRDEIRDFVLRLPSLLKEKSLKPSSRDHSCNPG